MCTIGVGIGQNADATITQPRKIIRAGVYPNSDCDVVDFL